MDWGEVWLELWRNHRGKMIGVLLGFLFGIFVVSFGFWKAVFISLCIALGFWVGRKVDNKYDFKEKISKIFDNN